MWHDYVRMSSSGSKNRVHSFRVGRKNIDFQWFSTPRGPTNISQYIGSDMSSPKSDIILGDPWPHIADIRYYRDISISIRVLNYRWYAHSRCQTPSRMRLPSKDTGCLHYNRVLQEDLIIFRWCPASFDSAWHLRYCSHLQTHKCAAMIPSSWVSPCIPGCNVASEDAQCISGTWARCRIFFNIFDRQCRSFFAEPETRNKNQSYI